MANVLIVEDQPAAARDLGDKLSELGHALVATSNSCGDAERAAQATHPDLVLMDLRMSRTKEATEAARRIREQAHVPIVFLSTGDEPDREALLRASEVDASTIVLVPYDARDVARAIDQAIANRKKGDGVERQHAWLSQTLAALADAVIAIDMEQRITVMNRSAEQLLGTRAQACVGRTLNEVLSSVGQETLERVASLIGQALRERRSVLAETPIVLRGEGERSASPIAVTATFVEAAEGIGPGSVLVLRDLQDDRGEARQRYSLLLTSLSTLTAGIAHEINNPLTATTGGLELLRMRLEDARRAHDSMVKGDLYESVHLDRLLGEALKLVDMAATGAARVVDIVRDLALFARPDSTRRRLPPRLILESAVRLVHNQIASRAQLIVDVQEAPHIDADEAQLTRALVSVLLNAAEAIEEGQPQQNTVQARLYRTEAGGACFEIRDSGAGMPSDVLQRMYDPFFTTKEVGSGTGLGLSVCRGIVHAHGGQLSATSRPNGGTCLRITLPPALAPEKKPEAQAAQVASEPSHRARLLIVDDEEVVRTVLAMALSDNYDVETIDSSHKALEMLGNGGPFDAVVSDLAMPEMDGITLYERAIALSPSLKDRFVFITGGAFTPRAERFLEGMEGRYLVKPFASGAIASLVDRVTAQPATARKDGQRADRAP